MLSFSLIYEMFKYKGYAIDVDPITGQEILMKRTCGNCFQGQVPEFLKKVKDMDVNSSYSQEAGQKSNEFDPGPEFKFDIVEPMY